MQEVYEENYKTLLKGSFVRPKCHGMNIYLPAYLLIYSRDISSSQVNVLMQYNFNPNCKVVYYRTSQTNLKFYIK